MRADVFASLRDYRSEIDEQGCEANLAVLTSAVRDASNGAGVRRRACATSSASTREC